MSKREIEVLRLLGHGLTNAEIAERLYISTKTAGNHVSNILLKLNLRNRPEAAAYAQRNLGKTNPEINRESSPSLSFLPGLAWPW